MEKSLREKNIRSIEENDDVILEVYEYYKGQNRKLKVYRVDTRFLVFNQYNGRIGTYVKTYEKFKEKIDASKPEHEKLIIKALWDSAPAKNKITKNDIKKRGQQIPGIITQDGVIVDGNRRCMCQKMIADENSDSPAYFLTAILPDTSDSGAKEIKKLETVKQMGMDEKVDYSPIEKYIKVRDLQEEGFSDKEIANMMGEKENDIIIFTNTLKHMDEYLKSLDREGMYIVLTKQKREGPFVDLRRFIEKHKSGKRLSRNWDPKPEHFGEAEEVTQHFIRAGFGAQQNTRAICDPAKNKGLFNNQNIWEKFKNDHFKIVDEALKELKPFQQVIEENPDSEADVLAMAEDDKFKNLVAEPIMDNLEKYQLERDLEKRREEPTVRLRRAYEELDRIERNSVYEDKKSAKALFESIRNLINRLEKNLDD